MADNPISLLPAVVPTGIPHRLKITEVMAPSEWRTLLAIMDTILPSVQKESKAPRKKSLSVAYISDEKYDAALAHLKKNTIVLDTASEDDVERYLADKPSDDIIFQQMLQGMLLSLPLQTKNLLVTVLKVLSTQGLTLPVSHTWTPLSRLPLEDRTRIVANWSTSLIPDIRGLHRQLTCIAKVAFTATNARFQSLSGFNALPLNWNPPAGFPYEFIQFPPAATTSSNHQKQSRQTPPPPPPPVEIETDVIIVGSGCGAGVCSKTLSEAGYRVLVVDKGYHFDNGSLPMSSTDSFFHLLEGAGAVTSDDNSILVVAGSCFGGGGTINWSASLQTQGFVRNEWAQERGLTFFDTQEFQDSMDRVCGQMGVHDSFTPNHGNQILLDGARKLGWLAKKVPQNTGDCEHADGHCSLGCGSGEKKGPVNGWFPDAAKNGAKFVEGFKVKRVLFDQKKGKKKAIGVVGTWTSRGKDGVLDGPEEDKIVRKVIVRAKKVIMSGGTLWSPVILKNSGLSNPQIGKNLYLHPVNVVTAFFKEDIRPWEGGILTTVVNSFENLDGKGHGAKLECLCMLPCFAVQFLNWSTGVDWKLLALKYRHMNSYISIVRDRDTGYVYPDPNSGVPRISYTPSAFDRKHAMVGNVALAKILYLQGALEIHAALPGLRPFIRDEETLSATLPSAKQQQQQRINGHDDLIHSVKDAGVADPRFQAWLKELEAHGNKPPLAPFTSAHQMGTCRMSTTEKTGVVDPRGRVWGTEGLYVSDASVFPSASGVNPMVTNMAISDWISRNVVQDMKNGRNEDKARL